MNTKDLNHTKWKFKGKILENIPDGWTSGDNFYLNKEFIDLMKIANNTPFNLIEGEDYICCEYTMNLNILSFAKYKINYKMTVIGLPVSICEHGCSGNINELIKDYKKRKGTFLILNLDELINLNGVISGTTLPTCIFKNRFNSFEDYLNSLRSSYRRRLSIAIKKGKSLSIKKINNKEFTEEMYSLYLNVVNSSDYPLEVLNIDFFRNLESDIYCFFEGENPVAFVQLTNINNVLRFVFGGMDYSKRDKYDLYYNMMILILKKGIELNIKLIDFGQTAEDTKLRLGCIISPKYMTFISSNKIIMIIFKLFKNLFVYKYKDWNFNCFKYKDMF